MIKIGTDCSGIESPIQALNQLNIPYEHVFSSEIDKFCIKSINANYKPKHLYTDMTSRDINEMPDIDLYVCGFPCQPFSLIGNRNGIKDKRGTIFYSCLEVIKNKSPKYFILENVPGLLSIKKGKFFEEIIDELKKIPGYTIHWKLLNTKDYGIPHHRKRVFIVGTRGDFEWPEKKAKMKSLKSFIDKKDKSKDSLPPRVINSGFIDKIPEDSVFVDLSVYNHTNFPNSDKVCPCIMRRSDIYCVPMGRRANVKELLALQGFENFKSVVSKTQIKAQIGNSISVNVLKEIFKKLLL